MMRFAFVTWDGGGNVPPAMGIAQELRRRGHAVVFLGYEVQRTRLQMQGMAFHSLRRSGSFDIYRVSEPAERIAGLMAHVWACPEHLDDLPEAVESSPADVVVIDFMLQGALAAAARLSVPVAVLAHSSVAGLIPPPDAPMGAARLAATNQLRARVGVPTLARLPDAWSRYLTVVTTIPELDPAAADAGALVRYVGPVFERFPAQEWDAPWAPDDARPLVLVSFTTTRLWDQSSRIRNTLEALSEEPVRVLVVAAQPNGDNGPIPANAAVRRFVPHALVLPSTAVTVTHAGHGTVAASLAQGVPLVALPNPAADQPFLAATLQRLGAGRALDGASGPEAIRAAVREVIGQPLYADAAGKLAAAIRAAPGVAAAAAELERLAVPAGAPVA
jgi:MGT family glycosyltransferase